jgi:hypothetical protein
MAQVNLKADIALAGGELIERASPRNTFSSSQAI